MAAASTLTPAVPTPATLRLSGERHVTLEGVIGRGSVANVLTGTIRGEIGTRRAVAVKVLDRIPPEQRHVTIAYLSQAMAAAACVCDPRVVQVYDYDLGQPAPFLVTELVDGGTLEDLIYGFERQARQLPHDVAILIALKMAEGVEAAHRARLPDGTPAGVVHGNLTLRDVFVSWSGEVKVKDFGLSQLTLGLPSGNTIARLAPMSPEVACGAAPDVRSDVFSLGMLLRHMLLGQRFSPYTTLAEAAHLVRAGLAHASLQERNLLPQIRAVLKRATDPDPRGRYASAAEMAAELRNIADFLRIPDVPAFVSRAVEGVFAPPPPPTSGYRVTEPDREPDIVQVVADIVDEVSLAYTAAVVERPDAVNVRAPAESSVSCRTRGMAFTRRAAAAPGRR